MGTIGHNTLLHSLNNWQIRAALRGYNRAQHTHWECMRQLAYYIMPAIGYKDIRTPQDVIKFPWDVAPTSHPVTEEEVAHLQDVIRAENAKLANK